MRTTRWAAMLGALAAWGYLAVGTLAAELKPGDQAPDFSLAGSDGKTHKLADFRGKQVVVLAWFPKAFTPGCTVECKSLRTQGGGIRAYDVAYFTISCDSADLMKKFAQSLEVDYPILGDPRCEVAQAYGVVSPERKLPQRWTFYIGTDGKILAIDKAVHPPTHGEDVIAKLKELGVAKRK